MKLPTIFKQHKNRRYQYTPRYYDERKERLEELKRKKDSKSDVDYKIERRRKTYRESWKAARKTEYERNSRIRIWVIFIFLLILVWLLLRYGKLGRLL